MVSYAKIPFPGLNLVNPRSYDRGYEGMRYGSHRRNAVD